MPDVSDLKNEYSNPVNADEDIARRESSIVVVAEAVDCVIPMTVSVCIGRRMGGVHYSKCQIEQEAQNRGDLVTCDVTFGPFPVSTERIWERHDFEV